MKKLTEQFEQLACIHGADENEFMADPNSPEKIQGKMREILNSLGSRKYFKKVDNLRSLRIGAMLCKMVTQEAIDERGKIPLNLHLTGDGKTEDLNFKLAPISFFYTAWLDEGEKRGLKGRGLLDFINNQCRGFVDALRDSIKLWDEEVAPKLSGDVH